MIYNRTIQGLGLLVRQGIVPPKHLLRTKEDQLAWLIAKMASEDWSLIPEIADMVGNRIVDNAGVAVAALNRNAVKISRKYKRSKNNFFISK